MYPTRATKSPSGDMSLGLLKRLRHRKGRARTKRRLSAESLETRRVLASYLVDTLDDIVADDGQVSLREAIEASNANASVNSVPAGDAGPATTDTISFAASLSGGTITLSGDQLEISDALSISLGAADGITIDGNSSSRVFSIDALDAGDDVAISGLDITGGSADVGGGVYIASGQSSLSLADVLVRNNRATGTAPDQGGGGLFNNGGTLNISDATIRDNVADGTSGSGGGILNLGGTLTIGSSTISGNQANRAGGGIETTGGSQVTLTDTFLSSNLAGVAPAVAAPGNGGGLHVGGDGSVTIQGGEVSGNQAVEGGGLWNSGAGSLTIDGTTISDNMAVRGGGVFNDTTADIQTFTVDLQTLNAAFGSTATGTAAVTLDTSAVTGPQSGTATIRVQIDAEGLQDLSGINGAIHVAHIHGQFAGNAARPLADQGDGPFFDGEGGTANGFPPVDSVLPTVADDGELNIDETSQFGTATDYLDFFEGRPDYGPVVLNLTADQLQAAPDGTPPLSFFFQQAGAGNVDPAAQFPSGTEFNRDTTYTFDLSDPDQRRQYNNLTPLSAREIVLHGLTIPTEISDAIDAATGATPGSPTAGVPLGNGMSFRATAPVAAGELRAASGSITISNATISGNTASGDGASEGGGGIFNAGNLTVSGSQIIDNVADGTSGSGGGIFNAGGVLNVTATEISGNTANRAGGGIEVNEASSTTLTDVNLDNNSAGVDIGAGATANPGNGGGLHVSQAGTVTITGGTVSGNQAALEGGGLWNGGGTMTVSGTLIDGNTASGDMADDGGGGIFNNGGTLNISEATIRDNIADGDSGSGGGILNLGGTLTVGNSTISGNQANRAGGGIETTGGSQVTLTDTFLSSNLAGVAPAVAAPGNGGGLHIGGDGSVTIQGGEVSGNQAVEGGGLWNSGSGSLTVDGTTISNNTAVRGGGVYHDTSADAQTFTVDLQTLNAAFGSTATGTAAVTLDTSAVTGPQSGTATIRVQIDAEGLQDLSGINGAIHVAHIHGQFAGNAARPLADQGDGPFFDGEGGTANGFPPVDSVLPTAADDGELNIDETSQFGTATDYLDFFEGRPDYGPVVLNLTADQLQSAPDGTPPLSFFFQQAGAGNVDPAAQFPSGTEFNRDTTYTFDLSDPDQRRQYNNLTPLSAREIVLHGLTIPTEISDAIDAATGATPGSPTAGVPLGNGMSFRATAPVAAGELRAASGSITISNATISGNTASGDGASEGGGGIFNAGNLTVSGSQIIDNVADGTSGSGGGIFNAGGVLDVSATEISGNTANRAGGGIEVNEVSSTRLTDVNLDNNSAGVDIGAGATAAPGNGGGLHVSQAGSVTISGGTVSGNQAALEGGGLWNGGGTMTVSGTLIDGNTAAGDMADDGGGGIFNNGGTLNISEATIRDNIADGTSGSGGGILNLGGTLTVGNSTISGNQANRAGGGIETTGDSSVSLGLSELTGNDAGGNPGNGGGLHITGAGNVVIVDTTLADNTATNEGGGLWNSAGGTMEVRRSTVSGNSSGDGGGIFNDGPSGNISLVNSTISGNDASGMGGGVASEGGTVTVVSLTVAANSADTGGGIFVGSGSLSIRNTIVGTNTATSGPDISGTVASDGNNLISDTSGATFSGKSSDLPDVQPGLAALADNGGPTRTHALLAGSAALDAGTAAGLATDQRGVARPQGPAVDIGAFESNLAAPMDDGEVDANDGVPGSADDGNPDNFRVIFNGAENEFVISVNGIVAQRIAAGSVDTIRINGSGDDDTITLTDTSPNGQSFEIRGFAGSDFIQVMAVAPSSSLLVDAGDGNDIVSLGDENNDASMVLGDISLVGGANAAMQRQLRGGNDAVSPSSPFTADSGFVAGPSRNVPTGDTLNINDASATTMTRFVVDMNMQTISRQFVPIADFSTFETVNLTTGSGNDFIDVRLAANNGSVVTVDGNGGNDTLSVIGTNESDAIFLQRITTDASPRAAVETTETEFLFVDARGGNDTVVNDTGGGAPLASSMAAVLSGGIGDDLLIGGNRLDVIFGGDGTDALFGGDGDDFLFADQDPDGTISAAGGELLSAGIGDDSGVGIGAGSPLVQDVLVGLEGVVREQAGMQFILFPRDNFTAPNPAEIDRVLQEAFAALAAIGFNFPIDPGDGVDIGEVDSRLLEDLDLTGQDSIRVNFTATLTGTLTAEAIPDSDLAGAIRLVLLNANGEFVAVGTPQNGNERLDVAVAQGQQFQVLVFGDNSDFDLRLTNMVSQNSPLTVHGTADDDDFELAADGEGLHFVVNGTRYDYTFAASDSINFAGNGGDDRIRLRAAEGTERVLSGGGYAKLVGSGYDATVSGIPQIEVLVGDLRPLLQNSSNPFDVTGDGQVTPMDALRIINFLNRHTQVDALSDILASLPGPVEEWLQGQAAVDVNGDNHITPIDALGVINALNRQSQAGQVDSALIGEGESQRSLETEPADLAIAALFEEEEDTAETDLPFDPVSTINQGIR